jgi:hypothetical protein
MGDKKVRRAKFFAENSHRCFCGGEALATTEDHVPSRSILDARQWLEVYRFPACAACNRVTRSDEVVIAMPSMAYPAQAQPRQCSRCRLIFQRS